MRVDIGRNHDIRLCSHTGVDDGDDFQVVLSGHTFKLVSSHIKDVDVFKLRASCLIVIVLIPSHDGDLERVQGRDPKAEAGSEHLWRDIDQLPARSFLTGLQNFD